VSVPCITPSSGLKLNAADVVPTAEVIPDAEANGDRDKVVEAAKLIAIQKQVGFSFEVEDEVIVNELIVQENCDRAKKMSWEQRMVDQ
jgi:hypothetical protein